MLKALHLKMVQSLTLTEAYSKSCLQLFIAAFLFCWEKAKMMEPYEETCYLWPGLRFASFYMRTVQSRTCTKVTRVGSATDTKPGRSEFIFRPVTCKCMKSSSSSRSYVITPKQSPSMRPFALLQKGSSNFWVCKWNLVLTFDSVNEI